MSDPKMIKEIQGAVSIPVMAKVELDISLKLRFWKLLKLTISMKVKCFLQLTTVSMWTRKNSKYLLYVVPRIWARPCVVSLKGFIDSYKGVPGIGDIVQAVRHMRMMNQEIRRIQNLREDRTLCCCQRFYKFL